MHVTSIILPPYTAIDPSSGVIPEMFSENPVISCAACIVSHFVTGFTASVSFGLRAAPVPASTASTSTANAPARMRRLNHEKAFLRAGSDPFGAASSMKSSGISFMAFKNVSGFIDRNPP